MKTELLNVFLGFAFLALFSYCISTIFKIKYDISSLREDRDHLARSVSRYRNDSESQLAKHNDDLINVKTSQISIKNEVDKLKTIISEYTNSNQKKK